MLGQLLDGRYKITQVLGAGGFGKTYIAEDIKLYNHLCVGNIPQVGEPPLHSPPPTVPAQYRQEIPQQSVSPPIATKPATIGMGFYLQWVLVNVAGLIAGFFMGAIAQTLVRPLGTIITYQVLAATMGLTVGYMQALILRRQIPISEKQWMWGTTAGACISLLL